MLRYCVNLKATRYESMCLNRIVADKSHSVIVVSHKFQISVSSLALYTGFFYETFTLTLLRNSGQDS